MFNFPVENLSGVCGIYSLIHRDTGACYVGSSTNIRRRMYQHFTVSQKPATGRIHRAIKFYGSQAFDLELLERCQKGELLSRERFYIALLGAALEDGFNTLPDPTVHPHLFSCSDVTRKRMSAAKRGKKLTAEHVQKIITNNLGRKRSAETCAKIGDVHRGRKRPASTCAKMSEFQRGRIRRPHSDATRAKMSASAKGKKKSPEHVANMKARVITEETRARICAAQQKRWARVRAEKELLSQT